MESALLLLGATALVGGLVARLYYGVTLKDAAYWLTMHTFVGQMMHDTGTCYQLHTRHIAYSLARPFSSALCTCSHAAIAKHKDTYHSKTSIHDGGSFIVKVVPYLEDNYVSMANIFYTLSELATSYECVRSFIAAMDPLPN